MKFFEKLKQNSRWSNLSIILNVFFIIFLVYFFFPTNKNILNISFTRESNQNYKFISPLLDCEDSSASASSIIFYSKADNFLDNLIKKDGLQTASVYYRDLNNGPWYGYNEKEYFIPASLIKLPIMIALFKYAENNPFILNKEVMVKQNEVSGELSQNIKAEKQVKVGVKYSMLNLVNYMIEQSDNIALGAVTDNFPYKNYLDEVFKQVGVDTQVENDDVVLRVKDYASFFRVLYNASYLSKDNSELALKILSESIFSDGLVAGVPKNIVVAHKFGERNFLQNGLIPDTNLQENTKQLHDCGIVYYPGKPYVLCVMTRGNDFKSQEKSISKISSYFYNAVSNSQ
jgi:beta-lactamase class A